MEVLAEGLVEAYISQQLMVETVAEVLAVPLLEDLNQVWEKYLLEAPD